MFFCQGLAKPQKVGVSEIGFFLRAFVGDLPGFTTGGCIGFYHWFSWNIFPKFTKPGLC